MRLEEHGKYLGCRTAREKLRNYILERPSPCCPDEFVRWRWTAD